MLSITTSLAVLLALAATPAVSTIAPQSPPNVACQVTIYLPDIGNGDSTQVMPPTFNYPPMFSYGYVDIRMAWNATGCHPHPGPGDYSDTFSTLSLTVNNPSLGLNDLYCPFPGDTNIDPYGEYATRCYGATGEPVAGVPYYVSIRQQLPQGYVNVRSFDEDESWVVQAIDEVVEEQDASTPADLSPRALQPRATSTYATLVNTAQPFLITHDPAQPASTAAYIKRRKLREERGEQVPYSVNCQIGETPCHMGGSRWECIDTFSSLESCGACPLEGGINCVDHIDSLGEAANGHDVSCMAGQCRVVSNQSGGLVGDDNQEDLAPTRTSGRL